MMYLLSITEGNFGGFTCITITEGNFGGFTCITITKNLKPMCA